jgi:hypothetical protein
MKMVAGNGHQTSQHCIDGPPNTSSDAKKMGSTRDGLQQCNTMRSERESFTYGIWHWEPKSNGYTECKIPCHWISRGPSTRMMSQGVFGSSLLFWTSVFAMTVMTSSSMLPCWSLSHGRQTSSAVQYSRNAHNSATVSPAEYERESVSSAPYEGMSEDGKRQLGMV